MANPLSDGYKLWPRAGQFISRLCSTQMQTGIFGGSAISGQWEALLGIFFLQIIANWFSAGVSVTGPCLARWSLRNAPFSLGGSFLPPSLQSFGRGPHPIVYFRSPPVPVVLPLILFPLAHPPWAYKIDSLRGATARAFQFPSSAVPALLASNFSYSLILVWAWCSEAKLIWNIHWMTTPLQKERLLCV